MSAAGTLEAVGKEMAAIARDLREYERQEQLGQVRKPRKKYIGSKKRTAKTKGGALPWVLGGALLVGGGYFVYKDFRKKKDDKSKDTANAFAEGVSSGMANHTQPVAPNPAAPPMQQGAVGPAVKVMQALLVKAGYSVGRAGIDGQWGPDTQVALKRFATYHSMTSLGLNKKLAYKLVAIALQLDRKPMPMEQRLAYIKASDELSKGVSSPIITTQLNV